MLNARYVSRLIISAVVVARRKETEQQLLVKLCDVGLAKVLDPAGDQTRGIGTTSWMPPVGFFQSAMVF